MNFLLVLVFIKEDPTPKLAINNLVRDFDLCAKKGVMTHAS